MRTEFRRYNEAVDQVAKQLQTVSGSVQKLGTRTRAMDRALKTVETMPDAKDAAKLLGLSDKLSDTISGAEGDDRETVGVAEVALLADARAAS